jgi:phosphatidylserine synthase
MLVYMSVNNILKKVIILCLFIATVCSAYIFAVTIIFEKTTYSGFFSSWQMPMLLALFVDAAYYKHIERLNGM